MERYGGHDKKMPKAIEILKFLVDKKIINSFGPTNIEIEGIAGDSEATKGDLAWIPHYPSNEFLNDFNGSMLICRTPDYTEFGENIGYFWKTIITQCTNPKLAMAMVIKKFFISYTHPCVNFAESAIVNTKIGMNVSIGPNCSIGISGQGYAKDNNEYIRFPQTGKIIIDDNVDIGANTVICRGAIGNTIIGNGTKIGHLVNIGHNVQIGKNVMIIAGAVICGSVMIDDNAWIGPGAMILNKIKIGKGAQVGIGSVVTKDVPDNATVVGNPARKIK